MALTALLHLVVRPDVRRSFYENYGDWFPRPYCERHRESFVKSQMAVYKGGDAWVPGGAVPNSTSTTHAHLVCSRLSLKVLAWWHSIQRPITVGVLLLRRPVARGSVSGQTSLQSFLHVCIEGPAVSGGYQQGFRAEG